MSYPSYWQSIITKYQDFILDIQRAKHKRRPVKITIEYHHKSFGAENKRTTTLDLKTVEAEEIVEAIEKFIQQKEIELLSNIEDYENQSRKRQGD
jgi:predicted site-specific integrase-resolvase